MRKTKIIKNGRIKREKCITCGQLIPLPKQPKLDTPDIRKMRKIMEKNRFTQMDLANAIGISQGTVQGWFIKSRNLQGRIKKIYFDLLKTRGYY